MSEQSTLRERLEVTYDWVDDHLEGVVIAVVVSLLVAMLLFLFIVVVPAEEREQQAWEDHCVQDLHGRVVSKDATTVGISTKDGSTIVTPATDYYCLSPSGGILDIR